MTASTTRGYAGKPRSLPGGAGLDLYNDPGKGNCASCHPSGIKGGAFPAFTDYGYVALACRAIQRSPRTRIPTITIWGCVDLCALICPTSPRLAGCSVRLPCGTSPGGRCSFITA